MSANLLAESDRRTGDSGTTYADGVWTIPANGTSGDKNAVNDYPTGTEAVSENQTLHVGLSVRAASGASVVVSPGVGYRDGAGNVNYISTRVSAKGTGAWQRVEGSFVIPSGMRIFLFFVHQGGGGAALEIMTPCMSYGSPVSLAVASHTPYATQGHLEAVYATQAQLAGYIPISGGTLTGNVTAPKFVGGLQGTADAAKTADRATTASRVADSGAGTENVARHVWFSDSGIETARVYNDAFRYNPVGNVLSCNVSGSAATAESAVSAAKLAKARAVTISGAVNGSATWDGSGDLSIVVEGDSAAAGFLAAHPVGTFIETNGYNPSQYGGEWQMVPSVGPYTWLRTK